MKLKEVIKDISLASFKVRIPDKHRRKVISAGLDTMEVHVYSSWFLGIWVKTDPASERVYPITGIPASETLEWEVVE